MKLLDTIARIANGVMDAINRKNKKDAANNAADTIANGSVVQHSKTTYSDLADGDDSNKPS